MKEGRKRCNCSLDTSMIWNEICYYSLVQIDALMQKRHKSVANTWELHVSCTNPLKYLPNFGLLANYMVYIYMLIHVFIDYDWNLFWYADRYNTLWLASSVAMDYMPTIFVYMGVYVCLCFHVCQNIINDANLGSYCWWLICLLCVFIKILN